MPSISAAILPAAPGSTGPGLDDIRALDASLGLKKYREEILAWAWRPIRTRAAIGTSFQGCAGLVLIDLALKRGLRFPVFTLDTGLLFPETVELKSRLENYFGIAIEALVPDLTVEQQAEASGPELWKTQPDLCCTMRKVLPLQSKLGELDCWITALRREQSETARDDAPGRALHAGRGERPRDRQAQPRRQLEPRGRLGIHPPEQDSLQPAARPGLQLHRLLALHPPNTNQKNERAGLRIGFNKVESAASTRSCRAKHDVGSPSARVPPESAVPSGGAFRVA